MIELTTQNKVICGLPIIFELESTNAIPWLTTQKIDHGGMGPLLKTRRGWCVGLKTWFSYIL